MSGQAASYYNPSQGFEEAPPQQPYQQPYQQPVYNPQQQQQQPYAPYPNQGVPESKHPEHPPTYNQAVYGFDEAFKIEKPKLNDLWAGLLVRPSLLPSPLPKPTTANSYSITAHRSLPRIRRHIWSHHPPLCEIQGLQRWRHLRRR